MEDAQRGAARELIIRALQQTLRDPRGRWLLDARHRDACGEYRLTGPQQGRVVNIVIDRMFIDEQAQRWIVDFKTSTHEGAAIDAFIDAEVERYRAQLSRYAALAGRLGPEPVRSALYFPLLGVFREIEPDPAH